MSDNKLRMGVTMILFAGLLALLLLLVLADLWLRQRRRSHDDYVRERMAAYERRLKQDWEARHKR